MKSCSNDDLKLLLELLSLLWVLHPKVRSLLSGNVDFVTTHVVKMEVVVVQCWDLEASWAISFPEAAIFLYSDRDH